ncbi:MAG TPA: DUF721 domain-containing protein [Candidatus Omnitrophota bacterium]|nr:DUF721 domain-containing protein [Candidatus Omnitrophota bacterium]HPS20572.1 DUF721 domain-containing protein [Candidatus Omnitrophota bacterium]
MRQVDSILADLLKKLEQNGVQKRDAVMDAWCKAAGEEAANYAQPVSFKKGQMIVIVANSAWLYKLTMEKRKIIKSFCENYIGRQKLEEIRFRVGKTE